MAQETELMHEDVLSTLPAYIGAQPFDDTNAGQDQIIKLAGFIRKYFPSVSPKKLEEIFEQAAAGFLMDGTGQPISVSTFGKQIGIEMLSRVLRAHAIVESRKVKIEQPKEEDRARTAADHYEELKQYMKEHKELPSLRFWRTIHTYLVQHQELEAIRIPAPAKRVKGRAAQALGEALKEKAVDDAVYKAALFNYFKKGETL